MPKLQPINDKLIIEVKPHKTQTASGIVIPDLVEKEQQTTGIVVAIGSDVKSDVKIGDRILIEKHSGTKITWEGKDVLVVYDNSIMAIYEE
jgi:chaperonin GroES